jgi:hypothetical protein
MEEKKQNVTLAESPTPIEPYKMSQFDAYLSYLALGGLITSDDGKVTKISVDQFCETYNVSRKTLWTWKTQTPNILELVRRRREEIVPLAREAAAFNQLFLLGMQTQDKRAAVDALKTYLGHFSSLRLPSQEVKHEVGSSFADLINAHRQETRKVIDATPND